MPMRTRTPMRMRVRTLMLMRVRTPLLRTLSGDVHLREGAGQSGVDLRLDAKYGGSVNKIQ